MGEAGSSDWNKLVPQITWTHALDGFIGDNQYVELDTETNWQPMYSSLQNSNVTFPHVLIVETEDTLETF